MDTILSHLSKHLYWIVVNLVCNLGESSFVRPNQRKVASMDNWRKKDLDIVGAFVVQGTKEIRMAWIFLRSLNTKVSSLHFLNFLLVIDISFKGLLQPKESDNINPTLTH